MAVAKQKAVVQKEAHLSVSELYEALYSTKKELFALRLQQATAQLRQTHLLKVKRRECARLLSKLWQIKGSEGIKG